MIQKAAMSGLYPKDLKETRIYLIILLREMLFIIHCSITETLPCYDLVPSAAVSKL